MKGSPGKKDRKRNPLSKRNAETFLFYFAIKKPDNMSGKKLQIPLMNGEWRNYSWILNFLLSLIFQKGFQHQTLPRC